MMKRVALITLTIGTTLLGIFLLWVFRSALGLFGGSLAIAIMLRPLVRYLEDRGIKRGTAIVLWYLLILIAVGISITLYTLGLTTELAVIADQLPRFYETFVASWRQGTPIQQAIARGLPEFNEFIHSSPGTGLTVAGNITSNVIGDAVLLIAMLSLTYYWLIEVTHFERLLLSLLPVNTRVRARLIWRNVEDVVGTYLRTTGCAIIVAGLGLLTLYVVLKLPFAATLALIGGLSHLVPRLGPALALVLAVIVALLISPQEALFVLIGGAAIQILIHSVAVRIMQKEALKVNPLLQVLLLLVLAELGGLSAMIFAPPLSALIQVLYNNLVINTERPQRVDAVDLLIDRFEQLRAEADPESLELISTLQRSDELLKQARELLGNEN